MANIIRFGGASSEENEITENIFTWTRGQAQNAQVTTVDISEYDYLRVYADYTTSATQRNTSEIGFIVPVTTQRNIATAVGVCPNNMNALCTLREVYSSNGKLAFGVYTNNTGCIIYKVDGIKTKQRNIVSALQSTLLWTNPSPTNTFPTQAITISGDKNINDYDAIVTVYYGDKFNGATNTSTVAWFKPFQKTFDYFTLSCAKYDVNTTHLTRFSYTNDLNSKLITFDNCCTVNGNGNVNDALIPYKVYGVTGSVSGV